MKDNLLCLRLPVEVTIIFNTSKVYKKLPVSRKTIQLLQTISHIAEAFHCHSTLVIVLNKSLVTQTEEDCDPIVVPDVGVYFGDRKELGKTQRLHLAKR